MQNLSNFPIVYILPTHMSTEQLHKWRAMAETTTLDINKAQVVLGNISKTKRALFELRQRGVRFDTVLAEKPSKSALNSMAVARIEWLAACLEQNKVLPLDDYLIVQVQRTPSIDSCGLEVNQAKRRLLQGAHVPNKIPSFLHRSTSEDAGLPPMPCFMNTPYACQRPTASDPPNSVFIGLLKEIRKQRVLDGDHVGVRAYSSSIASLSAYPYGLQSPHGKPDGFIPVAIPHQLITRIHDELKRNTRAWLMKFLEIARLPGCGRKVAELFREFNETGTLIEAKKLEQDYRLSILSLFHDIWGVGDATAREFYSKGSAYAHLPKPLHISNLSVLIICR